MNIIMNNLELNEFDSAHYLIAMFKLNDMSKIVKHVSDSSI